MGNSLIFGNDRAQDNTPPLDGQSAVACLAAQRAARQRTAALESQLAAQDHKPAAQEPEPKVHQSNLQSGDEEPKSTGKGSQPAGGT